MLDKNAASRVIRRYEPTTLICLVVGGLVAGCSSPVAVANRSDPGVQAEETRLAQLIESTDDFWPPQPRRCSVRLLRQEGATSYVWAGCEGPEVAADGQVERPARSGSLRIDGDLVSQPGEALENLEEMLPADLAEAILGGETAGRWVTGAMNSETVPETITYPAARTSTSPLGRRARLVAEKGLDDGSDTVAGFWIDSTQPVNEPLGVDRSDQFALDVAGRVETGGRGCLDFDVKR